jgi:LysM repeat protein
MACMRLRLLTPITALAMLAVPATASAAFLHTVMPGESLSSIAAADGLSVYQLAAANGLAPDAQLILGSSVAIPSQGAPVTIPLSPATTTASPAVGDGDADADDPVSSTAPAAAPAGTSTGTSGGSYVVQPGDTLTAIAARAGTSVGDLAAANGLDPTGVLLAGSAVVLSSAPAQGGASTATSGGSYVVQPGDTLAAIAARAGTSVSDLAAANGLDPNGVLLAGSVLDLTQSGSSSPAPTQAPAVGTNVVGRMTWFGGPNDPNAQGVPASGLGWRSDGMAYYNYGSLGGHWLIRFPWGQTLPMTQIDIGPAPWTGNPFDMAFSALPNTPYTSENWPNPTVSGTYQGP